MTNRADPGVLDLGPEGAPPKKADNEIESQLVRRPKWLGKLIKQAAKKEGMSVNAWSVRVLANAAKRSDLFDEASVPLSDIPKKDSIPVSNPVLKLHSTTPLVVSGGGGGGGFYTNPEPITWTVAGSPRTVSGTFAVPTEPSTDEPFVIPDEDIPDLS